MGHVISFLNLKGGVGKTSTCHHLAGTFARMGKRVLLLDNDPQASLTQGFYGPATLGTVSAGESMSALYDEDATPSPAARVPRAKDFVEAVAARVPVSHFKPRSAAAKAVQAVADELLVRVESEALDIRGVA